MSASKQQHQMVLWRRNQVMEFMSKGFNQTEIAKFLKLNKKRKRLQQQQTRHYFNTKNIEKLME